MGLAPGRLARTIGIAASMVVMGACSVSAKTGSVLVTAEMRRAAVENCEQYEWARSYRDQLIRQVEPWLAMSDEELWRLLPSQDMPRDSSVNRGEGCPNCGE